MKDVLIQGVQGAFHEIGARSYFSPEHVNIIPCLTFSDLFRRVASDNSLSGIVAVENTLAGSILPNLTLLKNSGVSVIGECKLRISLNLLALRGQSLSSIKVVYSHAVALMQCSDFLERHPHLRIKETEDTALSARQISEERIEGAAVVASGLAATLYNLEVLEEGIESNQRNFTRFLIIKAGNAGNDFNKTSNDPGKASLVFTLPHRRGSLSAVLNQLASHECNLTMIQSMPVVGKEWEYLFYIDMVFSGYNRFQKAMNCIRQSITDITCLGVYPEGKVYFEENICIENLIIKK